MAADLAQALVQRTPWVQVGGLSYEAINAGSGIAYRKTKLGWIVWDCRCDFCVPDEADRDWWLDLGEAG